MMSEIRHLSLSLKSLRILHRSLDDAALIIRVKSAGVAAAELERLLRDAGTDPSDIKYVLEDYRRLKEA